METADNGQEALDFLKTTQHWKDPTSSGAPSNTFVDVILLDQEMPVMNGVTCAKSIRTFQQSGTLVGILPIIAVSANARPEQTNEMLGAGMDDFITKPFRIPELISKIERLANWSV